MGMDKKSIKSSYKRYNPIAREDPEWFKRYEFILIKDMDMLRESFKDWVPGESYMSFDTETNDLDAEKLSIVGYSYSLDGKKAYYVPINHYNDQYNLGREGTDFIYERMCEAKRVFMFNSRFDVRVFEYIGFDAEKDANRIFRFINYDMERVKVFDVAISCWLADTNIKMPSLKDSALVFLGYRMQHFGEVTEGAENFQFVDPEDCCFYAASDALCTYLLVGATMKYFQEASMAAKLDNKVLYPLMHYEQEKIWLDKDLLEKFVSEGEERLEELEKSIYSDLGYSINLNSPAQVSQAFNRLGIDTGERTASGYMKTGIHDLEALPQHIRDKYPTLDRFVEYKMLFKQISSYAKVLYKEAETKGYVRCNYKTQQVPTGRLASGKDSKNTFFSPLNTQSIPKPHVQMFYVFDLHDRSLFSKKQNIMMGFEFVPAKYDENKKLIAPESTNDRTYMGLAEGMQDRLNMRASYTPRILPTDGDDECVFINIDYAAQELRVPANLSGEPVWVEAFCSGGDVHKSTACSIWGEDKYNKDYRKMAKGANFSILYGAVAASFAEDPSYHMTEYEAEEFYAKYKEALPVLFQWVDRVQRRARKTGTAYTYFGRPRRVKGYLDNKQFAFANRTITNTIVQGTSSDILKIVMCKLWKNVLNHPDYRDDVRFGLTVHDEIDYKCRAVRANEIGRVLEKTQEFTLPEWRVPIAVEVSFGWTWGQAFAYEWNEDESQYYPKLD